MDLRIDLQGLGRGGLRGFSAGLQQPWVGARWLFRHRSLWPLAAAPALISALLLLLFGLLAWKLGPSLYGSLLPDFATVDGADGWVGSLQDTGRAVVRGAVAAVTTVLCVAGTLLSTLALGSALAAPFLELLSEAVEQQVHGRGDPPFSWMQLARDAVRGAAGALGQAGLWLSIYLPLVLGSLLPVVGLLFSVAAAVYSGFFFGLSALEPTLERRKLTLRGKLGFARRHLAAHLGMGAGVAVVMLVPGLGQLAAPAFTVAGALFVLAVEPNESPESPPESSLA